MADLWLPGIPRVDCSAYGLGLGYGNNTDAYHTWHTFEGIPKNYNYAALTGARYLASTLKLAHFTYNPVLGGLVQLLPANKAARTLKAGGANPPYERTQTNCRGKVHMQTEVIANAARPWTLDLTRAGLDDLTTLMNFLRSWGVADQWAWRDTVRPAATYGEANAPGYRRMPDRSGHAFHSKWPWNDHWDPGAITAPWEHVGGKAGHAPAPPPPELADDEWPAGWVLNAQKLLNALGYTDAQGRPLAEDDDLGPATEHATRAYQRDFDLEPDGRPGNATTASLGDTMSKLDDILADVAAIKQAIGPKDLGNNSLAKWVRQGVNAATWSGPQRTVANLTPALSKASGVDANALARAVSDNLRDDLVAAVGEAGSGATAEQVVDELVRRLNAGEVA